MVTTEKSARPDLGSIPSHLSAIGSPAAHARLWTVAAVCLWVDLGTKQWAFSILGHEGRSLIPGFLEAQRSLNSGALFGSFSGWVAAFIVASLLALAFVLYVFAASHRKQWFLHLGLAFILSGALGNLYDRSFVAADVVLTKAVDGGKARQDIGLVVSSDGDDPVVVASYPDKARERRYAKSEIQSIERQGVVRDFLRFTPIGKFDYWPWVFNVADALLVTGVIMLMLTFWREHQLVKQLTKQEDSSS